MSINILFLDNETYGADDVNKAFSRLTTQGVSLFNDTGQPLTDINTAIGNLVEGGVEMINGDACKVVNNGGNYQILPGTAWMMDGSSITIEDEPYQLEIAEGIEQYVYFQRNIGTNTIDIVVSSSEPPEGSVYLAKISANGAVTDLRTFATTKVAPSTGNIYREYSIPDTTLTSSMGGTVLETFDAGSPWFQYILVTNKDGKAVSGGHQKLTEGVKTEFMKANPNDETINSVLLSFQKRGQNIDIYAKIAGVGARTHSLQFLVF